MLFKERDIILPTTFELLLDLQQDQYLNDFFLVGGTALALQIGHRYSIDLDLFSLSPFDIGKMGDYLAKQYGFRIDSLAPGTLLGHFNDVKADFITHACPLVQELVRVENLRLASIPDIGAMKLNAIANSGQRLKDFIDIYHILGFYPLRTLLEAYEIKYPYSNVIIPVKAAAYFEDIDFKADVPITKNPVSWSAIQKRILTAIANPDKVFGK